MTLQRAHNDERPEADDGFDDDSGSLPPFVLPTVASDCGGVSLVADAASIRLSGSLSLKTRTETTDAGPPQRVGHEVIGDYELVRELGRGGMGVVYEALDRRLNRRVALKLLPPNAVLDPKRLSRFQLEAQAVARLSHPHIVQVFDVGSSRGTHYLAMQLIDGKSLSSMLPTDADAEIERSRHALRDEPDDSTTSSERSAHHAERDGYVPCDTRDVVKWGQQVAEALDHAHKMGVIHRDVKPSNLIVDTHGDVWVMDFGLAQVADLPSVTLSGDLMGTLRYLSPEQAMARRIPIDHRTDIYSLGITLYELLAGQPAFPEISRADLLRHIIFESPRPLCRLRPHLPRELQTIIHKAIEKNPADRFPSAQEFADDLRRFLNDEPIHAKPPSLLEHAARWARHNRPLVAAGLLLLIAAAVVGWGVAGRLKVERDAVAVARDEARRNELKSRHNEWQSLVAQVGLTRRSDRAGRRDAAWKLIERAVELGRELSIVEDDKKRLRDEAIACLALHDDLSLDKEFTHTSGRYQLDFSPRGDRYARSAAAEGVEVHDAAGRLEFTLPPPFDGQGSSVSAQFSPATRWLMVHNVAPGREQSLVWDLESRQVCCTVPSEPGWPFTDFSRDGELLVTYVPAASSGEVRIIDLKTRDQVRAFPFPFVPINTIAGPQPNQMTFFRAGTGSTEICVWDITTGKQATSFSLPGEFRFGSWSRGGRWLAISDAEKNLVVWDAIQGQLGPIRRTNIHTYGFSSDDRLLAIETHREETEFWDLHKSRLSTISVGRFARFIDAPSTTAEPSESETLRPRVALYDSFHVSLYRIGQSREFRRLDLPLKKSHGALQAEFDAASRTLATATPGGVFLMDVLSGQVRQHRPSECRGVVFGVKSGQPTLFCGTTSCVETQPFFAEPQQFGDVSVLQSGTYGSASRHLAASRDGRCVAGIIEAAKARIWREDNPAEILLDGHSKASIIAISPDAQFAATSAWQGSGIWLWDARTGKFLKDIWPDAFSATCVFTADCQAILAGDSRRYRLIQVASGKSLWELRRRDASDASGWCAASPDGRLLAVTPDNAAVHLFDAKTFREVAILEQPDRSYDGAISFSPDGRWIARCSSQSVELWDLGHLQTELRRQGLDWE